jgi:hypothetical protein
MTDVLLVNFRNDRDMYPPFGIMYVADALMKQGINVELWHENEEGVDSFVERVEEVHPLWVGFSTITGPQLRPWGFLRSGAGFTQPSCRKKFSKKPMLILLL